METKEPNGKVNCYFDNSSGKKQFQKLETGLVVGEDENTCISHFNAVRDDDRVRRRNEVKERVGRRMKCCVHVLMGTDSHSSQGLAKKNRTFSPVIHSKRKTFHEIALVIPHNNLTHLLHLFIS